ncbi:MAG: HNH endonuclease [Chloroflexi bacterium]|nr:MAG: HNH endonuclease [Chloroflexota bacterium]
MQPARGPAHYNWKGGRTWERFRDPRYLDWRKAILERDGYKCQQCGRRCKKYERGLAAHHVRSWADAPELRFNLTNGVTLCRDCHMALHGLGPKEVPLIPCACGCGSLIRAEDPYGRPRRFVNHHHSRGRTVSAATRQQLSRNRRGRSLTPEHRRNISKGLRTSSKRIGRPPGARSTR